MQLSLLRQSYAYPFWIQPLGFLPSYSTEEKLRIRRVINMPCVSSLVNYRAWIWRPVCLSPKAIPSQSRDLVLFTFIPVAHSRSSLLYTFWSVYLHPLYFDLAFNSHRIHWPLQLYPCNSDFYFREKEKAFPFI